MDRVVPKAKVVAGTLGGALTTIIMWVIATYGGVEIPAEVGAALATILSAILAYLTPDHPGDNGFVGEVQLDIAEE